MRGRVKVRLCKPEESRFAPGEASPDSENSQLCWGGAESPLRKWHYPGKHKKFPAPFPLPLLVTTRPKEEATSGAKEQTPAAGPPISLGGHLLSPGRVHSDP